MPRHRTIGSSRHLTTTTLFIKILGGHPLRSKEPVVWASTRAAGKGLLEKTTHQKGIEMQYQLTKKILGLVIVLLFSTMGLLFTGESQADPAPALCAPNEAVTTIYYRTAAQLEPVGGMSMPGCGATQPNFVWGITSPYSVKTCGSSLRLRLELGNTLNRAVCSPSRTFASCACWECWDTFRPTADRRS